MLRRPVLRARPPALALLAALACADPPPPPPAAPHAAVEAAFAQGPAQAAAAINALPDPLEQVVAVTHLADSGAVLTMELCGALTAAPPRHRCTTFARRPHLTQGDLSKPVRERERAAPGPPAALVAPLRSVDSTLTGAAGGDPTCRDRAPDACRAHTARLSARRGKVADAAGLCAAISEDRWRWECAFEAAEQSARRGGAAGHRGMAELCLRAGDYRARCLQHGLRILSKAAPDAQAPTAEWADIQAVSGSITDFWADRDPAFGAWQRSRLWSYATWFAYAETPAVTGAALAVVPEDLHHHVVVAAATRLLEDPAVGADGDLGAAEAALVAALARPAGPPGPPRPGARVHPPDPRWNVDEDDEQAAVPATFCLGSGRRARGAEPAEDRRIALVEAAARQEPPRLDLVSAGKRDASPLVRWTATRVARWHVPGGPGGGRVHGPSEPRGGPADPEDPLPDRQP